VNGGDGHIFYKENTKAGVTYVEVDHGASEFRFTLKGVHLGLTESDFNL